MGQHGCGSLHNLFDPAVGAVVITGIVTLAAAWIKHISNVQVAKINNEPSFATQTGNLLKDNDALRYQNEVLRLENKQLRSDLKEIKRELKDLNAKFEKLGGK